MAVGLRVHRQCMMLQNSGARWAGGSGMQRRPAGLLLIRLVLERRSFAQLDPSGAPQKPATHGALPVRAGSLGARS